MCLNWGRGSPARDDQIDALPEWKIDIVRLGDMFEQSHPERGQRLMVKIAGAVMGCERANSFAHPLPRLVRRQAFEITQRHGEVRDVSEFGCRDGPSFKSFDQRSNFRITGKVRRFQIMRASPRT